jgi:choline dehydrogenase
MAAYDYLVVGSGSAGAVVASRLTEDEGCRVLLLEAGPIFRTREETPEDLLRNPFTISEHDWGWTAEPTPGRRIPYPRAKVSGGCSSVNGAIALRGDPEDFDEWVARGLTEWGFDDVLPWYRKLEDDPVGAKLSPEVHGVGGPVPITRTAKADWQPFHAAFARTAETFGHAAVDDLAAPSAEGVGGFPHNRVDGVRISTALAYLHEPRPNLVMRGGVLVDSLIIENGRAVGVNAIVDGRREEIRAGQVVLSAGSVATPGVLIRSGIGPEKVLSSLGITPTEVLEGVGAVLLDHPTITVTGTPRDGIAHDRSVITEVAMRYTAEGSPLRNDMQMAPCTVFDADVMAQALQGHGMRSEEARAAAEPLFIMLTVLMKAVGSGTLTVTTTDPTVQPRLELDYLREPEDVRRLADAVRLTARMCADADLAPLIGGVNLDPAILDDDDAVDRYVAQGVGTCFHPSGTAPMGVDPGEGAVVDGHGRVFGVDGLRVVDASIMPTIVRSNINITTIALAERISAWMRAGQ